MKRPASVITLVTILSLLLVACVRPVPGGGEAPPATDPNIIETEEPTPLPDLVIPSDPVTTDETAEPVDEGATEGDTGEATEGSEQPTEITDEAGTTETPEGDATTDETAETDETAGETEETPPTSSGGEQSHTVSAGETLYQISLIYGVSVEDLVVANDLTSPDSLDIGQILAIPEAGAADVATPPDTSTDERIHIVRAGETLYRIGLQYGFTVNELASYNNLADPTRLDIGQEIKIPPSE